MDFVCFFFLEDDVYTRQNTSQLSGEKRPAVPARTKSWSATFIGGLYGASINACEYCARLPYILKNGVFPNDGPQTGFLKIAFVLSVAKDLNGGKASLFFRENIKALRVLPHPALESAKQKKTTSYHLDCSLVIRLKGKSSIVIINQETLLYQLNESFRFGHFGRCFPTMITLFPLQMS